MMASMIRKALLLASMAHHLLSLVSSLPVSSSFVDDAVFPSTTGDKDRLLGGTALCRCQAEFEHFYDRRLQQLDESTSATVTYRYGEVHIDHEGYYHVDGIKVLDCRATAKRSTDVEHNSVVKSLPDLFNRDRDSSNGGFRQRLLGSKSSKSSKSGSVREKNGICFT